MDSCLDLSVISAARVSESSARDVFRKIRWASTNGDPVCPRCHASRPYYLTVRSVFKCRECSLQFSVTSGTIFAHRKLSFRDILVAIVLFSDSAKGISSLQLSRNLGVQYKTAFVLAHKLREAMVLCVDALRLSGVVEIDGGTFGGHR